MATIGVCVFGAVTSVAALFILEVKIGLHTPSLKKSKRARISGKFKRNIKKQKNPFYGKKGMGFVNNPKRVAQNKIYRKTTFGIGDIFRWLSK